jgi:hypothetical protein
MATTQKFGVRSSRRILTSPKKFRQNVCRTRKFRQNVCRFIPAWLSAECPFERLNGHENTNYIIYESAIQIAAYFHQFYYQSIMMRTSSAFVGLSAVFTNSAQAQLANAPRHLLRKSDTNDAYAASSSPRIHNDEDKMSMTASGSSFHRQVSVSTIFDYVSVAVAHNRYRYADMHTCIFLYDLYVYVYVSHQ